MLQSRHDDHAHRGTLGRSTLALAGCLLLLAGAFSAHAAEEEEYEPIPRLEDLSDGQELPALPGSAHGALTNLFRGYVVIMAVDADGNVLGAAQRPGHGARAYRRPSTPIPPDNEVVEERFELTIITRYNSACVWRKIGGTSILVSGDPNRCVAN